MDESSLNLCRQIERCRRIAQMMTDDDVRQSLENLAREYETRLPGHGKAFMLRGLAEKAEG